MFTEADAVEILSLIARLKRQVDQYEQALAEQQDQIRRLKEKEAADGDAPISNR